VNITCLGPRRRRHHLAICALFAALALTLTACGSSTSGSGATSAAGAKGLYGSLPPAGTPKKGGTITIGQLTGSTPTYIFPIVPGANASAYTGTFISNLILPLYNGPNGATPEINYSLSLANKPVFSDGDKTVTIPMKPGFKWANGQPVDANDLIFEIDLLKAAVNESASNWAQFVPGEFPTTVLSAKASGRYTVVLHLNRAYNPGFFLNNQLQTTNNVSPLPSTAWNVASAGGPHLDYTVPANAKKIYDYLAKAGGQVAQFATNPLWKDVDGPFALKSFSATNSSYSLVPNPSYGGSPKPYVSQVQVQTYTGITPQLNALRTGSLDVAGIDFSQLGQVGSLRSQGYSVFGYPPFGWFGAIINFKDKTNHFDRIISQPYIRQALAHLENQPAYLSGIFKNAGVAAYGPVSTLPPSPYTPADATTAPYPYSPSAAVSLLKSHGWHVVPNGTTTCAKAGAASGECGAGIPAGTPFRFTWFYIPPSTSPSSSLESEAFASEAKQAAGINIELHAKTFNYLIANFNDADPSTAKHTNDWGISNYGGFGYDFYPTSDGVFNTQGTFNAGAYSSPTADALIKSSVHATNPSAVITEASFLTRDIPVLFMPNSDYIWAVSKRVGGSASSFLALTELVQLPQFWYLTK
jgi:peptide/nickel transport system substrate-binding protein